LWRANDDSAETRLDEILALLNTKSSNSYSSLNDYLTDDGDVDTVRLDSDYEIDLPEEEGSSIRLQSVNLKFGSVLKRTDSTGRIKKLLPSVRSSGKS